MAFRLSDVDVMEHNLTPTKFKENDSIRKVY